MTMTTNDTTASAPRIVTVARAGSRMARVPGVGSFPIWVIAIYEGKVRKADGVGTWRRTSSVGRGRSGKQPSERLLRRAREYAERAGLPFKENVRHGQFCLAAMPPEAQVDYHLRNTFRAA